MIIHDITLTASPRTVTWEGTETGFSFAWAAQIGDHSPCNLSIIQDGTHCGTHLDAPLHFIEGGKTVETLDLQTLIGPALVVEIYEREAITDTDLENAAIPAGTTRVLFKTDNTRLGRLHDGTFHSDYVGVAPSAATWLVSHGVKLVGVDYLSVGPYGDLNPQTHRILLGASVVVVETLVLDSVSAGSYTLVALPPKFEGVEGSPCRALLIEGTFA